MVFKKLLKKKKQEEEVPEAPEAPETSEEQPEETPIIETNVEQEEPKEVDDKDIKYYQTNYATLQFHGASSDLVMSGLLFGILTEVRKLREEIKGKK